VGANLRRWQRHLILIGLAAVIAAGLWFWRAEPAAAPAADLVTIQGEKLALSALRGKVVLVNFWATDCAVCLKEMPMMVTTYRKYQSQSFEAVFIAMPYDRPDYVLHYARTQELPFKLALDVRGELTRAFGGVKLTPTTFIIDKRGRIVERILGEPDFGRLHALIERKLREDA
jgi:peroxiredoxin